VAAVSRKPECGMVSRIARSSALFVCSLTSACSLNPQAGPPDAPRSTALASATLASPPLTPPTASPPTESTQQAPEPSNRWTPEGPELNEDAASWVPTQLGRACEGSRPVTQVIESADAFRAAFCLEPELDWSRFRLAVFASYDGSARRALRVVDVVRHAEHWLVIVERSGACCTDAWDCDAAAAAIIPASPLQVQFLSRASDMPACVAPQDGYGY
jgi:hypothetical protein